ncbi:Lanosterol synthase like protein [Verticillium longisporum]|uniref:Lanosterol synthase like protein n=1 Tax=Verticillium longisporum TaxID=100787 RepID=A0A8I2ZK64_VERLO|nr:Lanosterol synthase like protein [Verticillium longisporum]
MSCSGTNSFCEEKSDFSTGDFAEATTDPSRWRLFSDGGRNVWHYLTRDEDIQKWPQTAVDRYHLGLSTGFPKVEPAITPMQSVINAVSVYSKLQLPSGHWACEEGGPLFLLPGLVITWFVTEASIPEAFKIEIKNYLFARQNADDGSWGLHIEAEGSVFGLAMNYTALRLLGVRADHQRLSNWLIVNIWNPYLRHDKLRTAAEAWVYDLIQHEDENTEYVNLGPVNAPMNTLVCYIQQGPKSTAMARHLDHLMDYLWKKDEGMLMNGTNGAQVWDTAFSIQAIVDTGLADDPRYQPTLMKALEFLEEHQIRDDCREQGICYRHYRKGAWPFSTRQQGYTVTDCTAEGLKSVLALQSIPGYPNIVTEDRLCDAVNILLSMQNNTGGCSSYELRRGSEHLEYLNAAEVFGQIMVEYDYVECTAACMLALDKFRKVNPFYRALEIENFIQRAIKFIRSAQRDDGSWYGSWGICFTYGTMFALEALEAVGDTWHNSESIRCAWLMQAGYPDMEPIEALEGVFNKSGMISYTNYKYIFPIKALGLFARKYGNINVL